MAYQVYFSDMREANHSLMLAILHLKEEAGTLEPDEKGLLAQLKEAEAESPLPVRQRRRRAPNGHAAQPPEPPPEESAPD